MSDQTFKEILRKGGALIICSAVIIFIGTRQLISAIVCGVLIALFYFWVTGEFKDQE